MSTVTENGDGHITHIHSYPSWSEIDLHSYNRFDGMYTLGFIQKHRPDIYLVADQTESLFDPDLIMPQIETGLQQGKKVCLFFWDEDFIMPSSNKDRLNRELESYADQPVYLCSNMSGECLLVYKEKRSLPIKPLHVPWRYLEYVVNVSKVYDFSYSGPTGPYGPKFACYNHRKDHHRDVLTKSLVRRGLQSIGDITYANQQLGSGESPVIYYQDNDRLGWVSGHDDRRSIVTHEFYSKAICHAARNIPRLNKMLGDTPLVITAETNLGVFPVTEKCIWPILLGRMFMVYARPRIMRHLQKYVGYSFEDYLDLEFDSIDGWSCTEQKQRLDCMLDRNLYTITHAREVWESVATSVQNSAKELPVKIYAEFCQCLDEITE